MLPAFRGFTEHGRLFATIPHGHAHPGRIDLQFDLHRRFAVKYGVGHQLADEELRRLNDVLRKAGQCIPHELTGSRWTLVNSWKLDHLVHDPAYSPHRPPDPGHALPRIVASKLRLQKCVEREGAPCPGIRTTPSGRWRQDPPSEEPSYLDLRTPAGINATPGQRDEPSAQSSSGRAATLPRDLRAPVSDHTRAPQAPTRRTPTVGCMRYSTNEIEPTAVRR